LDEKYAKVKQQVLGREQKEEKSMNPALLIQRLFGSSLDRTKSYPQTLPPELQRWYCYPLDGGHSIVVAIASRYASDRSPEEFLVPAPVKTVLRGYESRDGYIVVDLPYNNDVGLITPAGDEEF
jgi:hypothetical protein